MKNIAKQILTNSNKNQNSSVLINTTNLELKVVNCNDEYNFIVNNNDYKLLSKFDKYNKNINEIHENLTLLLKSFIIKK